MALNDKLQSLQSDRRPELDALTPLDKHNLDLLANVHPQGWRNPVPQKIYNLLVIGAGAGGLVSAAGAAGLGGKVALVEENLLGGDCLNVGCVPSKAWLASARAVADVRRASGHGVSVGGAVRVDFGLVMERLRRLRAQISPVDSARRYTEDLGVDLFFGRARFTGPGSAEVDGRTITFKKAIIATGGRPAIPDIPGLDDVPYLTNETIFNLTELPARLGVIGVGPIGMELAQAFARFGSQVTVFARGDRILVKEEPEAAAIVHSALVEDGVKIMTGARFVRIESDEEEIRVSLEGGEAVVCDAILVAAGRQPAVSGLGLEEAGVSYDSARGIVVDDFLRTTNPAIYGVGDVASPSQFTHAADFMARLAIQNSLFWGRSRFSKLNIPRVTYTDPEVSQVGMNEVELGREKVSFRTYRQNFSEVDRAIVEGGTRGFVKIHVVGREGRIVGATIVGSHAGEMISEISVAMKGGVGLGKLASVIHPYPTLAEAIRRCGDAWNRDRLTPGLKKLLAAMLNWQRR